MNRYYAQINHAGTRWRLCSPDDRPLSPWTSKREAVRLADEANKRVAVAPQETHTSQGGAA